MGRRIRQIILECDKCGKVPEDGEDMWYMGTEVWCAECCDSDEDEAENKNEHT